MKVLRKMIDSDGSGGVSFMAECDEDMFHVYNLVHVGDCIEATTYRKIYKESATGSVSTEKVKLTLKLAVKQVHFDPEGLSFRIKGKNMTENKFVKLGQYHTIELELHRKFTIFKQEWTSIDWQRIKEASNPSKSAEIAAVVMDLGKAAVCLVTDSMTIVKKRINKSIPKKRNINESTRDKAVQRFYYLVLEAIQENIDFDVVKVVLIASPGFVKDDFMSFMSAEAVQKDITVLKENKSKFVSVHSTSGHVHALSEILADEKVQSLLSETKAAKEMRLLDRFLSLMSSDADKAAYGFAHVLYSAQNAAVEHLLIVDTLFRSKSLEERKKYTALCDLVKSVGGKVNVFSSLHVSGQQLQQLTGVAAILRFPLQLDEIEFA
eukprot:m.178843 g.178843  ORF g.178843 m.178843 type:complete len:379 (-) comp13561_c0_seq1:2364-3500(-)